MKLIIFDLDGTILDTLTDLKNSVNYSLKLNNYNTRTTKEIKEFVGNGIEVLVKKALPYEVSEAEFEKVFTDFKNHYEVNLQNETKPYPGILELLGKIKEQGYLLGVVSNKFQAGVDSLVKEFFNGYFDIAVGLSEKIKAKPATDAFIYMFKELNQSDLDRVIFIGDSEVDILTARNVGIKVIAVTWGFRTKEILENHKPDYLVDVPEDILKIIQYEFIKR